MGLVLGTHVPQHERPAGTVQRWDSTTMPVELKYEAHPRSAAELAQLQIITVHVTDVAGGFGLAKYQVDRWAQLLRLGKVDRDLLAQAQANDTDDARDLSLLERYSRDAYHRVGSRQLGSIRNHPLSLRTAHGNGGNIGPGWALDCGRDEVLTPRLRDVGVASLLDLCDDLIEHRASVGAEGPIVLVPHRVWSSDRGPDTNPTVWRGVVLPVVETLRGAAVVGYNTKGGSGRYIPRSWDPAALYDDRGRRLV